MGDGRRRDPARGTEMGFDTYWSSADLTPKQKDLEVDVRDPTGSSEEDRIKKYLGT